MLVECPLCPARMQRHERPDHLRTRHGVALLVQVQVAPDTPAEPAPAGRHATVAPPQVSGHSSLGVRPDPKQNTHRTSKRNRKKEKQRSRPHDAQLRQCAVCKRKLPIREYEHHIRVAHPKRVKATPAAEPRPRRRLCRGCQRTYPDAYFDLHTCIPRGSSVRTIGGGAPGQGRRH